ncbi:hypothetical protein [Roseovarius sp. MBR-51]
MKAIAEYFRDLAADDRYFGAEPPTPDAEMLARIAEREIARRVDAHEERGKIVLRAGSGQALMPRTDIAETRSANPAPGPERATEATEAADSVKAAEPIPTPQPVAEVTPESFDTDEAAAELETLADMAEAETEIEAPVAEDVAQDLPEGLEDEPRAMQAESEVTETVFDSESIAEKLSRIRSVVAQSEEATEDQYTEDEHAQDFLDSVAEDLSSVLAEDDRVEADLIEDDLIEDTLDENDFDREDPDEEAALPAVLSAAGTNETKSTEAMQPEEIYDAADDFEDTLAALMADAQPKPLTRDDTATIDQETEAAEQPTAHVIKVKRTEFEAAVANGIFEEDESDEDEFDDDDDNFFGATGAALSPEEEAELQRELAEVEAELAFEDAAESEADLETDAEEEIAEAERTPTAVTPQDNAAPEVAEEPGANRFGRAEGSSDLTRIFEKTDTHLEAPASSQRRNAIQHLRAAVAATRAEHNAGSSLRENVDDSPYRSDLASVVRPRRPQIAAPTERSARPEESRPAPLKLVAEQRIDTPRAPIRPRRISSTDVEAEVSIESQAGSFGAFAEEMGASSLPDLLEAAAAYLSDVEGRPQFSRPMLMGKLKEVEKERFSREDGLRSFGQLLRQGKLQKLAGGRFAVTEETEFRATGRRHAS